jgi:hypothetical protein
MLVFKQLLTLFKARCSIGIVFNFLIKYIKNWMRPVRQLAVGVIKTFEVQPKYSPHYPTEASAQW